MSYRKREIAHWNQGKGCKGTRKAKEREFVMREVDEQLAELNPDFRYRHKARHPNKEAQLKGWIAWYEQRVAEHEREAEARRAKGIKDHWSDSWNHYARDGLRKARKQLAELQEKRKNVVRSQ